VVKQLELSPRLLGHFWGPHPSWYFVQYFKKKKMSCLVSRHDKKTSEMTRKHHT
jgi:hypothetical protein